jgi:predicted O-methyltransferase YrrM
MLTEEFLNACNNPSDINEHLPLLYKLGKECKTIVEMGVRTGVSTRAFLLANAKLTSYDIKLDDQVTKLFELAKKEGRIAEYIQADTRNIQIEECEMLFIDTLHTNEQLTIELNLHGNKATKYLVFHDTCFFGAKGHYNDIGLLPAIIQFMIDNPHWQFKIHKTNNNGLLVLERKN